MPSTEIKVGQIWRENDPRYPRYVKVTRLKHGTDYVAIRKVLAKSGRPFAPRSPERLAQKVRFNGKRSGYSLVEDAPC